MSELTSCPFCGGETRFSDWNFLIEKATPIPIGFRKETENGGVISECYICPRCEKDIYEEEQRYCDFCGQRLKWSE